MVRFNKMINWKVISVITLIMTIAIYMTFASGSTLYVNGKKSSLEPFERNGMTYVPLETIVKGMGDKYEYIHPYRTAFIEKANGEAISLTNGKSVAIVEYKFVPLSPKEVNNVEVPSGHKAMLINDTIYVPIDFIKNVMKYNVKIDGKNVYVGKLPNQKNDGNSKESNDSKNKNDSKPNSNESKDKRVATVDMLATKWNYAKISDTSASLNVYNPGTLGGGYEVLFALNDSNNMNITIKAWPQHSNDITKDIPPSVKDGLNTLLGNDGNKVYNIVSNLAKTGKHNGKSTVKTTANGYNVEAFFTGSSVKVNLIK